MFFKEYSEQQFSKSPLTSDCLSAGLNQTIQLTLNGFNGILCRSVGLTTQISAVQLRSVRTDVSLLAAAALYSRRYSSDRRCNRRLTTCTALHYRCTVLIFPSKVLIRTCANMCVLAPLHLKFCPFLHSFRFTQALTVAQLHSLRMT